MNLRILLAGALVLGLHSATAQHPTQKQVPPPGIEVPEADRAELTRALDDLAKEIAALRSTPSATELLPDVEIFHKSVDYALQYNEVMDPKHIPAAKIMLAEGMSRAKALRDGKAPWTAQTGLVVRGFRSRVDGSVQPYGMVVPKSWNDADKRRRRLDVFNHGRNDKLTEIAFITERMKSPGEFVPDDAFVLHPYGRFCNSGAWTAHLKLPQLANFESIRPFVGLSIMHS